ncbi:MAG: DUF2634 domain-containing protein [Nitrospirota bacterium]|nr:DUF2634 domain-containing protein [Nitrospirota bacterium]
MGLTRYTIQSGDTLRQIARRLVGNADQWWVLAQFNQLSWPFIDTTGTSYPASQRVLSLGSVLLVPIGTDDPAIAHVVIPQPDLYTVLLGVDLLTTSIGDLQVNYGTGDLSTVQGVPNLQQAVQHRLMTRKGELPHHPEYGSNLPLHIGHVLDQSRVNVIRMEILQTLLADPRIKEIKRLDVSTDADAVHIVGSLGVIGQHDAVTLNLVIPSHS